MSEFQLKHETYQELLDSVRKLYDAYGSMPKRAFAKYATQLIAAAKPYGIHRDVSRILSFREKEATEKNAVTLQAIMERRQYLPIRNKKELKAAAEWLLKYRDRFPYPVRKQAACRILQKLKEYAGDLSDSQISTLYKTAGLGIGNPDEVVEEIRRRIELMKHAKHLTRTKHLEKLAQQVKALDINEFYTRGVNEFIVEQLDAIDKTAGLSMYYGTHISFPEDVVYGVTQKDVNTVTKNLIANKKTGKYYTKQALSNLDTSLLLDGFGPETVRQVTIGPVIDVEHIREWLKEASEEQAKLFDCIAQWSGVYPYAEKIPER